jgi:HEAT repeat protein
VSDIGYLGRPRGMTGEQLAPLIEELHALGYDVATPEDLPRTGRRYRDAVPLLLEWLPRLDDIAARESAVRALSVQWARPDAIGPLLREFELSDAETYRWAVGNALSVVADDSAFDDLARIVRDRKYSKAREMVAVALGNMKKRRDEARRVLTELLVDEELVQHALLGLETLGDPASLPAVERLLTHDDRWIRACAKKAAGELRAKQAG